MKWNRFEVSVSPSHLDWHLRPAGARAPACWREPLIPPALQVRLARTPWAGYGRTAPAGPGHPRPGWPVLGLPGSGRGAAVPGLRPTWPTTSVDPTCRLSEAPLTFGLCPLRTDRPVLPSRLSAVPVVCLVPARGRVISRPCGLPRCPPPPGGLRRQCRPGISRGGAAYRRPGPLYLSQDPGRPPTTGRPSRKLARPSPAMTPGHGHRPSPRPLTAT